MKKQFKAESKRLLDLMIHSIYTNKDIFLRELISNASDALDKRYFLALSDDKVKPYTSELAIQIQVDKDHRTLTIVDTGIGMMQDELENNLGTIAKSGSLDFKQKNTDENIDIIGQFGVGFYSAFMVAKKITVESRSPFEETAYCWQSEGEDGYTIKPILKEEIGTKVILELKEDSEEENYSEYLDSYKIQQLVSKYSDYIRYPIKMDITTEKTKEDSEEKEIIIETKTLNSMVPLWKRNKKEITEEEYNNFYMNKFTDWNKPAKVIHYNIEGNISYNALLFIPSAVPYNFYSSEYQSGLQLYSKGVFIKDKAHELVPEYFRFVKGLVDSNDLNLNISREILQQDRQMKLLEKSIEKKIKNTLEDLLKHDRSQYEAFFDNFGLQLKYGIYQDYGMHAETLKDLILFKSSYQDQYTTLKEYISRLKENQEQIYYVAGHDVETLKKLPQMEQLLDKGYEVLYLLDSVDEFALNILRMYDGKAFKSVQQGELDLQSEEEKQANKEKIEENKDLLSAIQEAIKEHVKEVKISSRLKSHPVCLVADEGLSIEMEKVLKQNPEAKDIQATKILEINPNHQLFETLQKVHQNNPELIKDYAEVLYDQALLIEGLPIKDPIRYANKVCQLMIDANK